MAADYKNITDEQLARLALSDAAAFSFLAVRCRPVLFRFVYYNLARQREEAEDIVQEALLRAYLGLRSFDPERKWNTWLFRIAINCACNIRRRRLGFLELDNELKIEDQSESFDELLDQEFQRRELDRAIKLLDPQLAAMLKMYAQNSDLSVLAKLSGEPVQKIKARLRRAKIELLANLKMDQ